MNPSPGRGLRVQAYDEWDIPNWIDPDPSPGYVALARQGIPDHMSRMRTVLGPPSGRYNCHGLVFASRRTNIPPVGTSVDIHALLLRDRYRQVAEPEIGDIIVYRDNREVVHTGIIIRIETVGGLKVPLVWSKWGSLEECVHAERQCPDGGGSIEYWRLRHAPIGRGSS